LGTGPDVCEAGQRGSSWHDGLETENDRKDVEGGKRRAEMAMGGLLLIYLSEGAAEVITVSASPLMLDNRGSP